MIFSHCHWLFHFEQAPEYFLVSSSREHSMNRIKHLDMVDMRVVASMILILNMGLTSRYMLSGT